MTKIKRTAKKGPNKKLNKTHKLIAGGTSLSPPPQLNLHRSRPHSRPRSRSVRPVSWSRSGQSDRSRSRSRSGQSDRSRSRSRSVRPGRSLSRSRSGRSLSRSRSGRSLSLSRAAAKAEAAETRAAEDKPAASIPHLTRKIPGEKTETQREKYEGVARNILYNASEGILFISDQIYYIEPHQHWIKNDLQFLDIEEDNNMLKKFVRNKGRTLAYVEVENGKKGYVSIADKHHMLSNKGIKQCEDRVKACENEKGKALSENCRKIIIDCNNTKRLLNSGGVISYDGRTKKSMDIEGRQLNPFARK